MQYTCNITMFRAFPNPKNISIEGKEILNAKFNKNLKFGDNLDITLEAKAILNKGSSFEVKNEKQTIGFGFIK